MVIVLNCRRSGLFRETTYSRGRVTRLYWEQGYKSTDKRGLRHRTILTANATRRAWKTPNNRTNAPLHHHGHKRELADIPTLLSADILALRQQLRFAHLMLWNFVRRPPPAPCATLGEDTTAAKVQAASILDAIQKIGLILAPRSSPGKFLWRMGRRGSRAENPP
jgi:hypothetical protein